MDLQTGNGSPTQGDGVHLPSDLQRQPEVNFSGLRRRATRTRRRQVSGVRRELQLSRKTGRPEIPGTGNFDKKNFDFILPRIIFCVRLSLMQLLALNH